jgi:hypothetical protein
MICVHKIDGSIAFVDQEVFDRILREAMASVMTTCDSEMDLKMAQKAIGDMRWHLWGGREKGPEGA